MKFYQKSRIFSVIFGIFLIFGLLTFNVKAEEGPPTPEEAFDGHNFEENYWDINVFNNSNWDAPEVNNETSWLDNTWNIKWIKEGNFEMGMLAFINKTHYEMGEYSTYTTPTQFWWQHFWENGTEILIASMHCAWFGFGDNVIANDIYDNGEQINPFFYMGMTTPEMRNIVGIKSNPKTESFPLQRSVNESIITYTWGYNYSDIIFYIPKIEEINGKRIFKWDFNYEDPGSYIYGSSAIGNQTYISYTYTLEVDTEKGESTLYQNYEAGKFDTLMIKPNETSDWIQVHDGEQGYMPDDWALALGTWSFIWADQDWALADLAEGEINATTHKPGLTEVNLILNQSNAFDFKFNQKPTYDLTDINDTTTNTYPVYYESLDIESDGEFINFISGMLPLMGDFARLIISYAINQTNHFTYGVPYEDAWDSFAPDEAAAFFITSYPKFGESGGGKLVHDPVFVAYFEVSALVNQESIPGYALEILIVASIAGITIVLIPKKKVKKIA